MRPGPDAWQPPQTLSGDAVRVTKYPATPGLVTLTEEQRRLIDVLQTHPQGMTMRQLETKLSLSRSGIQPLLDSLLETQLVARLNTLVPSYVYRFEGVDLDVD